MLWCMFATDVTAIYCDILQNLNGAHVFYYVCFMRISALTCSVLQSSNDWTQNPPALAAMGVRPPPPGTTVSYCHNRTCTSHWPHHPESQATDTFRPEFAFGTVSVQLASRRVCN